MQQPKKPPFESMAEAFHTGHLDLIEAREVLIGLNAHCIFDLTGSESDGHLVALKTRAVAGPLHSPETSHIKQRDHNVM